MDTISQLLTILSSSKTCEGNSDEHLLSLPSIHKNKIMNQSSKQKCTAILTTYSDYEQGQMLLLQ